jgi:hypothetical protein
MLQISSVAKSVRPRFSSAATNVASCFTSSRSASSSVSVSAAWAPGIAFHETSLRPARSTIAS